MTDEIQIDPNDVRGNFFFVKTQAGFSYPALLAFNNTTLNDVMANAGADFANYQQIEEADYTARVEAAQAARDAARTG
jgi:hypothetical protein